MKKLCRSVLPALLLAALAAPAAGYSQAGHMVTGAIAYDELRSPHPLVLAHRVEITARAMLQRRAPPQWSCNTRAARSSNWRRTAATTT
jgi:hypothetical protein